ncbi:hypothetical protein G7Y89_g3687 [Cudoniella acicularis]|uniref:BBC1/AIM3 cysteine proteinase-fold domain-containing protein n=1 Tax=Cudoniella acicularis TaxID=354080 RepID=A0A8H4W855_9HELO|nr:hypothetical protein G7Y89_g3687 [Cudoniella acicularis]
MSGLKEIAKGGWHPKGKDGKSKESWRGDFKGVNQVAGWMGKGKDPNAEAHEHVSRPLSTLKDPAAFGPPPKNVNFYGDAPLPNQVTPDTSGVGRPLSREKIAAEDRAEEVEATKPKPPPVPYRADTTDLSTTHLPPPPGRRDGADGRTPLVAPKPKPKPPGLPPRLPPRQSSNTASSSPSTADPHKGILNQGYLDRLGAAGVSVPGFGIGDTKRKPPLPPPSQTSSPSSPTTPSQVHDSQLNELQSRFSHLSAKSPKPQGATEGTTFAQKQAALKTAASFREDPSSVSLSDAKLAANKVGAYGGIGNPQSPKPSSPPSVQCEAPQSPLSGLGKKKPAPPPPMRRVAQDAPPPIPLSSKPKPQSTSSYHAETHEVKDLDLDLKSLWFASPPPAFPLNTVTRQGKVSHTTTFCESKIGEKVGNGECWTLANEGLKAVTANCSSRVLEPCTTSQSLIRGHLIYSFLPVRPPYPDPKGGMHKADVVRGDIIQLLSAHFKARDGMSKKWAGAPDHTAVITGVDPNGVLRVVEQNAGVGSYDMLELVKCEIRIFRAVGESWLGPLKAEW